MTPSAKFRNFLPGIIAICAFMLLSPKWLIPFAAWVGPGALLYCIRNRKPWHAYLLAAAILFLSGIIGNYSVMPFPIPILLIMALQMAITGAVPYLVYSLLTRKIADYIRILLFPAIMTSYEFLSSFGGGGTWGSIAYSQINNLPLMQLASIIGLWGVSFLIYWFASLANAVVDRIDNVSSLKRSISLYATSVCAVLIFGMIKINPHFNYTGPTVRIAAITGFNVKPLLKVYEAVNGSPLNVDVKTLTQTSPELQQLNSALATFIEDPFNRRFLGVHNALEQFQDSLFLLAEKEAAAGAKVISFSEALVFTFKPVEHRVISRGQAFAKEHNVRILLTLGSFIPGKIQPGTKYIENKAFMINERGVVENVFFKNKPVPLVEGSVPGDGQVPVITTRYAKFGVSICYDADFPSLIRKAGTQGADVLLLPSGDWKQISPCHADMARVRAIENGFSMVRPASGAATIACDFNGKVIGTRDFYDDQSKVLTVNVPANRIFTVYKVIGDAFAYICMVATVCAVLHQLTTMRSTTVNLKRSDEDKVVA